MGAEAEETAAIPQAAAAGGHIAVEQMFGAEKLYKLLSEMAGMEVSIPRARIAPEITAIDFAGTRAASLQLWARSGKSPRRVAVADPAATIRTGPMEVLAEEATATPATEEMAEAVEQTGKTETQAKLWETEWVKVISYRPSAKDGSPS